MMDKIEKLTDVMNKIGVTHGICTAQVAIAWAIAKGTLPIIGVTKPEQVIDAAQAVDIKLTTDEIRVIENTADSLGLNTIRYWEKKME